VPEAVLARMAAALRQVLAEPEIVAEYTRRGLEPFASSPAELAAAIQTEQRRWAPVVRASGVTPEG
jgi:tripartite-type tricarboxylate transporter receptor subunit TctC